MAAVLHEAGFPCMLESNLRLGILPCPTPANKLKIITTLRST